MDKHNTIYSPRLPYFIMLLKIKILYYLWVSKSDKNSEKFLLKEKAETKTFAKVNVI